MASSRYRTSVTWDGHEMHELFVVERVDRPVTGGGTPVTQSIGMTPGVALVGMRYDAPKVSMTLACVADMTDEIRAAWATLAGWLHVDGERVLAFGDDDGWCYHAVPQGGADASLIGYTGERAKVTFLVPDARMWAVESNSASSSASGASLVVGGTAPARPVITSYSISGRRTFYVDGQESMTVDAGGVATAMVIDCESRTVTVGGEPALLSLDQDFAELEPGAHVVGVTEDDVDPEDDSAGVGPQSPSFKVTWRDSRWC